MRRRRGAPSLRNGSRYSRGADGSRVTALSILKGHVMRQMVLVGFLQAQNCTTLASSWRHPESRNDFTTAAFYQKIGQVLEEGKFQLAFFDDRLAMPDIYGGDPAEVVANGVRVVKLDPVATLLAMGFGTSR